MTDDPFDLVTRKPPGPIPFTTPHAGGAIAEELDPDDTVGADGVAVSVLLHPDDGEPCIGIRFLLGPNAVSPLIVLRGDHSTLPKLVTDAVGIQEKVRNEILARLVDRAVPDVPPATCAGCGCRVFGAMAQAGRCLSCQKDHQQQ